VKPQPKHTDTMKKIALLASVLFASTAAAQTYSVNAVGYINTPLISGFNLVANQLNTGGNSVAEVYPVLPDGTMLYTYSADAGFRVIQFDGEWLPSGETVVAPGTGHFLRVPAATTVTYVGDVPQGALTTPLVAGFNLVGSKVPQTGKLQADLGYQPADGDLIYQYGPGGYTVTQYDGEWLPAEPAVKVGEGLWIRKAAAGNWTRQFSVNGQ
jgi:hypothetical protein